MTAIKAINTIVNSVRLVITLLSFLGLRKTDPIKRAPQRKRIIAVYVSIANSVCYVVFLT
jgi:hypothetical protein